MCGVAFSYQSEGQIFHTKFTSSLAKQHNNYAEVFVFIAGM